MPQKLWKWQTSVSVCFFCFLMVIYVLAHNVSKLRYRKLSKHLLGKEVATGRYLAA